MGGIGYFWKNVDDQLPAEGGFSSTSPKPQQANASQLARRGLANR
jgi:hypothetical protein